MAYMAQQWLATAARDAFRGRPDALDRAAEAARIREWLASLPLDHATIAALVEPIAALEDGLRRAGRGATGGATGDAAAGASSDADGDER
jgi:hypothetical protein